MNGLVLSMKVRLNSLTLFAAAASLPLAPVLSQAAPATKAAAQPAAPAPAGQPVAEQLLPPPPLLPPPLWDTRNAVDLLSFIQQIGSEGLNPADYDSDGLMAAMASGDPVRMSAAASERFTLVANDLALGHVSKSQRGAWFITDPDLDAAKTDALLRSAVAQHAIGGALRGLLPTHPQYAALKAALAATPATEAAKRDRIRLNLDRWRWLPRDLGGKYIIVNVPGFHATLVENGVNRWKHKAIAGATKTPTPQLAVMAEGVMLNPWWEVPPSITKEVAGKPGYVALKKDGKILRWRQPPGPSNALGQLKFVMYNPQNIYLHDTNARSRFSSRMRALSHGCVRTENILDLATQLLGDDGGEWTPDKIQAVLESKKTKQLNFVKPVPVYIVYFTSAGLNDGRIVDYNDLYARDRTALAALNMKDGGARLARAKPKPQPKPDQVASR